MTSLLSTCLAICALIDNNNGVSTKMDFSSDEGTPLNNNTSNVEDEDVEVKHTIVVSTKLKNNARRGVHTFNDEKGTLIYNIGRNRNPEKEDSGEVPIISGYKALDTTQIRTPDSRHKSLQPSSILTNRNIRDEYDIYPNLATNPTQWRPSSYFNNINSWNQDFSGNTRRNGRPYHSQSLIDRKIAENTAKEFYCRKCLEMSNGQGVKGCVQTRNSWIHETTTTKMKIDGKLAKLN